MAVEDITTKQCSGCKETKPTTEFHNRVGARDGFRAECKSCRAVDAAARYIANAEKVKAAAAAWYAENHARARAVGAKWYADNSEKVRANVTSWRKANPEACRILKHNRRARKREAGGKLSKDLAAKLFKLQRGKCACCGKPLGDNYHLDHIMPLELGGTNTDNNIQLLRSTCNQQKYTKHPVDFMQQRGFLL